MFYQLTFKLSIDLEGWFLVEYITLYLHHLKPLVSRMKHFLFFACIPQVVR